MKGFLKKGNKFVFRFNSQIYPLDVVRKHIKDVRPKRTEQAGTYFIVEAECSEEEAYDLFAKVLEDLI